jgi:hypothetical protein
MARIHFHVLDLTNTYSSSLTSTLHKIFPVLLLLGVLLWTFQFINGLWSKAREFEHKFMSSYASSAAMYPSEFDRLATSSLQAKIKDLEKKIETKEKDEETMRENDRMLRGLRKGEIDDLRSERDELGLENNKLKITLKDTENALEMTAKENEQYQEEIEQYRNDFVTPPDVRRLQVRIDSAVALSGNYLRQLGRMERESNRRLRVAAVEAQTQIEAELERMERGHQAELAAKGERCDVLVARLRKLRTRMDKKAKKGKKPNKPNKEASTRAQMAKENSQDIPCPPNTVERGSVFIKALQDAKELRRALEKRSEEVQSLELALVERSGEAQSVELALVEKSGEARSLELALEERDARQQLQMAAREEESQGLLRVERERVGRLRKSNRKLYASHKEMRAAAAKAASEHHDLKERFDKSQSDFDVQQKREKERLQRTIKDAMGDINARGQRILELEAALRKSADELNQSQLELELEKELAQSAIEAEKAKTEELQEKLLSYESKSRTPLRLYYSSLTVV